MKLKSIEKKLSARQRKNRYLKILSKLPPHSELEPLSDKIRDRDLILLSEFQWDIFDSYKIKELHYDVYQNCHAVSAYNCIKDNALEYVYGLASTESCCSSFYYFHSFNYNPKKNIIIEPTPIPRDNYFGVILRKEIREEYITEELGNIRRIGLVV